MLKPCDNMSVTGKSINSSILKSSGKNVRSRLNETIVRNQQKVRFHLPPSKQLVNILRNFVDGSDCKEYERLLMGLLNSDLEDDDVYNILQETTHLISILNLDLRLFVEALLSIKWTSRSETVITEYQSFLLNLLSAHNYHTKYAIDMLVSNFIPASDEVDWPNGVPTDEDCNKCVNIHRVLSVLLKVIPMCKELLLQSLINQFPYFKKSSHIHEYYLHNLLWILDYHPQFRPEIFHLIFNKLVILDVNAPRDVIDKEEEEDEIFSMDETMNSENMKHSVAHTLDICMDKMTNYIIMECHEMGTGEIHWDKTKALYQDMLKIFDQIILPTYNTHHVQFVMFVICCFKPALTEAFLNYLWKKVCTPNVPAVLRQAAVSYMASLIARGTFVPIQMLKGTLQQMADWIHSYIATQDGLECVNSDVRLHGVFYSCCQSLFYVVAFRQKDLLNTRKHINFLETLNLAKIVTCRLNPLRVCQAAVVQNFAAVTRKYQLAYCYSVMEHNSRNVLPIVYQDDNGSLLLCNTNLEAFFPFDPYVLKRSSKKITPFYMNYQGGIEDFGTGHTKSSFEVDDDFISEETKLSSSASASKKAKFTYGTSPGFKQHS